MPKRDQETERTVSNRGRAKETDASENPRSAKFPEPSEVYENHPNETETREPGDSAKPGRLRELGGISNRENESNDRPPRQEVRDP